MSKTSVKRVANLANNQVIIYLTNGSTIFNSYGVNIAERTKQGKIILDKKYWCYSYTTSKYRCEFLNERKAETEKKIKEKIYKLADLNK